MSTYIATFFSHYGAVKFNRRLAASGIRGTLMPIPRKVSSSCGTCVSFTADEAFDMPDDDLEHLFRRDGDGYTLVSSNM